MHWDYYCSTFDEYDDDYYYAHTEEQENQKN